MEPALIYFLGVLVLLLFLVTFFRRQIKMNLIRIKYGKYSYKYVKQFKKYTNKSPFPYCFKDDIMPYLRLSKAKKENIERYQSENILFFEDIPYHSTITEILEKYGEPDCFNAFIIKQKELRAYGYKKTAFGAPVKAVFFFIFQTFVMGEYIIDDLTGVDVQSVSKSLLDEGGVVARNENIPYYIEGKNKTSVYFYENGFSALIRYSERGNVKLEELL